MSEKNNIHESKKKEFEYIELPVKLLDYFLQSNKSNMNQIPLVKIIGALLYTTRSFGFGGTSFFFGFGIHKLAL